MRPDLFIAILLPGFTCVLSDIASAQQGGTADPKESGAETSISALRSLAIKISQCQETLGPETKWGKRPLEVARFYIGAPKNVTWRSERIQGVPYPVGYIEFSSSSYQRVPQETAEKYQRSRRVVMADAPITPDGVPFVPTLDGSRPPDTDYRYEFDLRPGGPQLANIVSRSSSSAAWHAETGHPCGPRLQKPSQ